MGEPLLIQLFIASAIPVVKILLICGIGAFCARKGLLTAEGRRVLGALSFLVFNPSLIFVKLASTLTPSRLLHWWPLMLNTGISTAVGLGLGYLGVRLVRPVGHLRPHTVVAIALGNLGNLPLVIVSSLAASSSALLGGIPPDRAEDLAVSYVVVGLLLPSIAHATIGFSMLRKREEAEALPGTAAAAEEDGPTKAEAQSAQQHQPSKPSAAATVAGPASTDLGQKAAMVADVAAAAAAAVITTPPQLLSAGTSPHPHSQQQQAHSQSQQPQQQQGMELVGLRHHHHQQQQQLLHDRSCELQEGRHESYLQPLQDESFNLQQREERLVGGGCVRQDGKQHLPLQMAAELAHEHDRVPLLREEATAVEETAAAAATKPALATNGWHHDTHRSPSSQQPAMLAESYGNHASYNQTLYDDNGDDGGGVSGRGDGGGGAGGCDAEGRGDGDGGLPMLQQQQPGWGQLPHAGAEGRSGGGRGHTAVDVSSSGTGCLAAAAWASVGATGDGGGGGGSGGKCEYGGQEGEVLLLRAERSLSGDWLLRPTGDNPPRSRKPSWLLRLSPLRRLLPTLLRHVWREATSPPLLAILLSIPVGCIPSLQRAFFGDAAAASALASTAIGSSSSSSGFGSSGSLPLSPPPASSLTATAAGGGGEGGGGGAAPLALVTDCLSMLGDCTIPSILIILGATLANGPGAARVPLRVTALVTATRLLLLPLLGGCLVLGAYAARLFEAPDPIYLLVLLIQNTAPTAIMVHTMASVHGNRAEEVSSILFWGYMVGIVAIPLWLTLFLYAVSQQFRGAGQE